MPHQTILLVLGGVAAGVIGSFAVVAGGVAIVPLLVLVFKVPIHYAIGTGLMCIVATSSAQRMTVRVSVAAGVAVVAAFFFYSRGDVRPIVTATLLLGVIAGSGAVRLFGERVTSSALRLTIALSWCLFLVGVLADAVDPIAFGVIQPAHIPLLPRALIHGSPAAMMHIGILILLAIPVVRIAAPLLRRFRSV